MLDFCYYQTQLRMFTETNPIVTMGPSGPIGRPAMTPAEHEMNLMI